MKHTNISCYQSKLVIIKLNLYIIIANTIINIFQLLHKIFSSHERCKKIVLLLFSTKITKKINYLFKNAIAKNNTYKIKNNNVKKETAEQKQIAKSLIKLQINTKKWYIKNRIL